jgi:hypothetical protein
MMQFFPDHDDLVLVLIQGFDETPFVLTREKTQEEDYMEAIFLALEEGREKRIESLIMIEEKLSQELFPAKRLLLLLDHKVTLIQLNSINSLIENF